VITGIGGIKRTGAWRRFGVADVGRIEMTTMTTQYWSRMKEEKKGEKEGRGDHDGGRGPAICHDEG
jgi:hypothetical protein